MMRRRIEELERNFTRRFRPIEQTYLEISPEQLLEAFEVLADCGPGVLEEALESHGWQLPDEWMYLLDREPRDEA